MKLTPSRPDLASLGVVGLIVIGVAACAVARVPIPEFLPTLGMFIAGGGLGLALNTGKPTEQPPAQQEPLAAAALPPRPRPAPPAAYGVVGGQFSPADTGVIPRVAVHE